MRICSFCINISGNFGCICGHSVKAAKFCGICGICCFCGHSVKAAKFSGFCGIYDICGHSVKAANAAKAAKFCGFCSILRLFRQNTGYLICMKIVPPQRKRDRFQNGSTLDKVVPFFLPFFWEKRLQSGKLWKMWSRFGKWNHFGQRHRLFSNMIIKEKMAPL